MSTPPGLYYYPTAIPGDLAERLTTFVEQDCALFPVPGHNGKVSANARQVAHYGHRYDYTSGATGDPAPDFPPVLEELCALIYTTHDELPDKYWFDQCIINRYLPGQGIGAHYDREEYGPVIACFTLGTGAEMEFTKRGDSEAKYIQYVEPRSLYVMSGASRYQWLHQQRPRKSDPLHGARGVRWSFTFRAVQ